ncbi:MAG: hypothetical protein ACPGPF_04615 [Pontibacterium sp.]
MHLLIRHVSRTLPNPLRVTLAFVWLAFIACSAAKTVLAAAPTSHEFLVGVGGYELCMTADSQTAYREDCPVEHTPVTHVLPGIAPNVNSVSIWITRDWQESWYSIETLQKEFIDKGYTPVFLFYWFADEITPTFIEQNADAYRADLARLLKFIRQLDGPKWVVLDPEFNQGAVNSYTAYNDFLIENIRAIKAVPDTLASFCLGDFGFYENLEDQQNWQNFHPSIKKAAQEADFISFQEMRAQTRNPQHHMANTADRALAFATYLHKTYQKPTYFAYLALSSYAHNADASDNQALQAHVYKRLAMLMPKFKTNAGLIGFSSFHLTDVPYHIGYFNEAEAFFGLRDKNGVEKPAFMPFTLIH